MIHQNFSTARWIITFTTLHRVTAADCEPNLISWRKARMHFKSFILILTTMRFKKIKQKQSFLWSKWNRCHQIAICRSCSSFSPSVKFYMTAKRVRAKCELSCQHTWSLTVIYENLRGLETSITVGLRRIWGVGARRARVYLHPTILPLFSPYLIKLHNDPWLSPIIWNRKVPMNNA